LFLTIVERELRVGARRKSTYRIRVYVAGVASLVTLGFLVSSLVGVGLTNLGAALFLMLSFYAFAFALLAGVFITADSISEEKREGTLGLLFLTGLLPFDIVVGKFLACSLTALFGLLALVPVLGVPLLFGGVTAGEFWRMALFLPATMFYSLAIGIYISALNRRAQAAMSLTFLMLLLFTIVFGFLNLALQGSGRAWAGLLFPSPFHGLSCVWETAYTLGPQRYWWTLLGLPLHGLFWLGLTAYVLPRVWQDEPRVAKSPVYPRQLAHVHHPSAPVTVPGGEVSGDGGEVGESEAAAAPPIIRPPITLRRVTERDRLLDNNPVLWLSGSGSATVVWVIVIGQLVLAVLSAMAMGSIGVLAAPARVAGFILKIMFAFQACRFFVEARRNNSLEMLLSTPLTDREILDAQWQGLRQVFLWPFVVLGIQTAFSLLDATSWMLLLSPFSAFTAILSLIFDPLAIGWFGMWLALSSKNPGWSVGRTILLVIVLPSVLFCIPDFVIDLIVIGYAKQRLEGKVRSLALNPTTSDLVTPNVPPGSGPPPFLPG
jgi:ABC-type transport system involved in multi-copper enzyme maturation permease subunit